MTVNLPNVLTVLRILLTPLFVICVLRGMFAFGLAVFAIAAISDALDGALARMLRQRSHFGAILDPVADKLLLTAAYLVLPGCTALPAWLSVLVISRDALIAVGFLVFAVTRKHVDIQPLPISKCNTTFQLLTVLLVLVDGIYPVPELLFPVFFWTTCALTVASGLHYLYIGLNLLQEDEGKLS
jgi:cardiolipin synthase